MQERPVGVILAFRLLAVVGCGSADCYAPQMVNGLPLLIAKHKRSTFCMPGTCFWEYGYSGYVYDASRILIADIYIPGTSTVDQTYSCWQIYSCWLRFLSTGLIFLVFFFFNLVGAGNGLVKVRGDCLLSIRSPMYLFKQEEPSAFSGCAWVYILPGVRTWVYRSLPYI